MKKNEKGYLIDKLEIGSIYPFETGEEVSDLNKINIFFGINGVGKTQISKNFASFIKNKNFDVKNLFVFNRNFVEENFIQTKTEAIDDKDSYIINKENRKIKENVDFFKEELKNKYKQINNGDFEYEEIKKNWNRWRLKKNLQEEFVKMLENKSNYEDCKEILNNFKKNEKKSPLEKFVDFAENHKDSNNKEKGIPILLERLNKIKKTKSNEFEDLQINEIIYLSEKNLKKIIQLLDEDFIKNKSSDFTCFINLVDENIENKNLHFLNWLNSGWELFKKWQQTYSSTKTDKCLFCQKSNFLETAGKEYKIYFNQKNFKNKKSELVDYSEQIKKSIKFLEDIGKKIDEIKEKTKYLLEDWESKNEYICLRNIEIKNSIDYLKKIEKNVEDRIILKKNCDEKINSQDQKFLAGEKLENIKKIINSYLKEIKNFLSKKEIKILELKKQIFSQFYESHKFSINKFVEKWNCNLEMKKIIKNISEEEKKYNEEDDKYILGINENIKKFNFQFEISRKRTDGKYKIISQNLIKKQGEVRYKNISEGEKTVVSLLYFLEIIKKQFNEEKKPIIVIDDPVSSLVRENILTLSGILKKMFFKAENVFFEQLFVLSHDFYFLNELCFRNKESIISNFIIYKKITSENKYVSEVKPDRQKKLKNIYRYYWYAYNKLKKELKSNEKLTNKIDKEPNVFPLLLPNIMRNIIEFFLQFYYSNDSKDWKGTISENFKKEKIEELKRWIDKCCHSDSDNSDRSVNDIQCEGPILHKIDSFERFFDFHNNSRHREEMLKINENIEK